MVVVVMGAAGQCGGWLRLPGGLFRKNLAKFNFYVQNRVRFWCL